MTSPSRCERILDQLLKLKAAGSLGLTETRPGSDVYQHRFRVAGWSVTVDLDVTVLELRAYYEGNVQVVATGAVPPLVMETLLAEKAGVVAAGDAKRARDGLAKIVSQWRDRNARLFVRPPAVARHPDNWNRA